MEVDLKIDNVYIQIRDKLQRSGVKLWLEPYLLSTGPSIPDLQRLAEDYSKSLNIDKEHCYAAISELQTHSLNKLKERKLFNESGIATLRVKILLQNSSTKLVNVEIMLSALTSQLRSDVANQIEVPEDRLKLIANGRVLQDSVNLYSQGIQNGTQILVLALNESSTDIMEKENRVRDLEMTKEDTNLLAADNSFMELEDQAGNPIKIPAKERKALMVAMALHEKGRTALKSDDFAKALTYFLDADSEFSQCQSEILTSVDNHALLDLDIAWCYLCLKSVDQIPEAYKRLNRCESILEKSYGPNFERVIALKGSPGNEAVLFLRLHLLQGIVQFHQNNRPEARRLLQKVESELRGLKVDEGSLMTLLELGFSAAEARIGLRAAYGDVNHAANYINENREKREESRKKAITDKLLQDEQKRLGMCDDGKQFVNPMFIKMLVNMGYNKVIAQNALKKCNNIISDSIQYIIENPGPSRSKSTEMMSLIEDLIPELESIGFDYKRAKIALKKCNGDILEAANYLITHLTSDELDDDSDDEEGVETDTKKPKINEEGTSKDEGNKTAEKEKKTAEEDEASKKKKLEAYSRLAQDIKVVDDDHLDYPLHQEETFLRQYLSLLQD